MFGTLLGLSESRASYENPSVSLNDPAAYDLLADGARTEAGVRMGNRDGLRYAPVWRAVSMISGDLAKLPLDVYRRLPDGAREKDPSHPASRVLRRQANEEESAFRFRRRMFFNALIWNHAEAFIDRNGRGEVLGLYPLLPDRTYPERIGGRLYYVTETSHKNDSPWLRPIPAEDVLSIRGPHGDDMDVPELVKNARESWAVGLAQQKFSARFFGSGGRTGGILEVPLGASKPFADNLAEGFRKAFESSEGWFRTVILRDGAKFHEANRSPEESQFVEASERHVRDVARWFNVQPSRLGVKDSVSYNSRSEDNQEYLDSTLAPWLEDEAQESYIKLLSRAQRDADRHFFEHNTNSLLRLNPLQRYQTYAIGVRNRILLPNEARAAENLNPIEGGDEFPTLAPKSPGGADKGENNTPRGPAADAGETPDEDDRSTVSGDTVGTADPDQQIARRRVVFALCARARDKAKRHRAFGEWLAGGLVSHRDEARRLLGDDSIVEGALILLRAAEDVPLSDLEPTVDRIATELERGV